MSKVTIKKQLLERQNDKVSSILRTEDPLKNTATGLILKSPDDTGVQRNGGKLGARFAPRAIISELSKLELHSKEHSFLVHEASSDRYGSEFAQAQLTESEKIEELLSLNKSKVIQLGGGHDHIYPLLRAIDKKYNSDLLILNIDAHLDTRTDTLHHSGTPFRQFSELASSTFEILQLGVRKETNNKKNYTPLEKGQMSYHPFYNEEDYGDIIKTIKSKIKEDTILILSLDCDGIDGGEFGAVSATNPFGTPFSLVNNLVIELRNRINFFGVYELNPLFDNITNLCAKRIAWLIYQYLLHP